MVNQSIGGIANFHLISLFEILLEKMLNKRTKSLSVSNTKKLSFI